MEINKYLQKMKEKQIAFLKIIEEDNENGEISYQELIELLENQQIRFNQKEFKSFLYFLSNISQNHHRTPKFYGYIDRILQHYKNQIYQFFENGEIYKIFKGSKRILLFLIKEKILIVDQFVQNEIKSDKYFSPELNELNDIENSEDFEKNRQIGENESYICKLIRDDSVEDFVAFCNKKNLPVSSFEINHSIFETNSFLLENKSTSLIEYAAFYGSIQIFQYLKFNRVDLKPSLWLYAIHGKNGEIIHLLEENHIEPDDKTFCECYNEAIKCHHNEIANYIKDNLLKIDKKQTFDSIPECLNYYNFAYIQSDQINKSTFNYLCRFDYDILVEVLLRDSNIDINSKIIHVFFL